MNEFWTGVGWFAIVVVASALVGAVSEWLFGGIGKIVNRFRSK